MEIQQARAACLELIVALMQQGNNSFNNIGVKDQNAFKQLLEYEVNRKPEKEVKKFVFAVSRVVHKYNIPTEEKRILNIFDKIK